MSHLLHRIERINQQATDSTDWSHQIISQVDRQCSTRSIKTVFKKPYWNSKGKAAWSDSDGYTVHLPSLKIVYHDKRTEYLFKLNECQLEKQLEQIIKEINHVCV